MAVNSNNRTSLPRSILEMGIGMCYDSGKGSARLLHWAIEQGDIDSILSNRESGDGRPDLILRTPSVRGRAVIIEIKVADRLSELKRGCEAALCRIEEKNYEASLRDEGYDTIIKYGICFYKKECLVQAG